MKASKSILHKYLLLLTPLTFLLPLPSHTQPYCSVHTFSVEDGLASNSVNRMTCDNNGIMWFGTNDGLCYYDGYGFSTFRGDRYFPATPLNNRIMRVESNSKGGVWCINHNLNLLYFDTHTGSFIVPLKPLEGKHVSAYSLYNLGNGTTWIEDASQGDNMYLVNDSLYAMGKEDAVRIFSKKKLGISGERITDVKLDEKGRQWIMTSGGGLLLMEDSHLDKFNMSARKMILKDHAIFFSTDNGVLLSMDDDGDLPKQCCHTTHINSLASYGDDFILLATDSGLDAYDCKSRRSRKIISDTNVLEVFVDKKLRLWAFCLDGTVMLMQNIQERPQILHYREYGQLQTHMEERVWTEDAFGTIWLSPKHGVFAYYDEKENDLVPYLLGKNKVPLSNVKHSSFDKQGNMWCISDKSLALVNFRFRDIQFVSTGTMAETRAITGDVDGNIFTGDSEGLLRKFSSNGDFICYISPYGKASMTPAPFSGRIYSLTYDTKGNLWIGTKGNGLFRLKDGNMQHYVETPDDKWSLSHNDIYAIHEDLRGHIWIGTFGGGLNLVDETHKEIRFINTNNLLKNFNKDQLKRVRRITHQNGVVIVSCTEGLVTFSDKFSSASDIRPYLTLASDYEESLLSGDVMQTLVCKDGTVLLTSLGGALQQIESIQLLQDNLKFKNVRGFYPVKHNTGGCEGSILSMIEDRDGMIWLFREQTINKFDRYSNRIWVYGPNNLPARTMLTEAQSAYNSNLGRVYAGVSGGLLLFSTNGFHEHNYIPEIVFTDVTFHNGQQLQLVMNTPIIDIPYDKRELTLRFTTTFYGNNSLLNYAYKIEGRDKEWIHIGTQHSITLTGLSAGQYRIIVRSTNEDGEWVENDHAITLNVKPTFSETLLARILLFILLIVLIALIVRAYLQRQEKEREFQLNQEKVEQLTLMSAEEKVPSIPNSDRLGLNKKYDIKTPVTDSKNQEFMDKLMEYLENHLNSNVKIDDLADVMHMNRRQFTSKLREIIDMRPVEFLQYVRIQRACYLIHHSNMTFSEIAYNVGFSDPKYFTRCFHNATGLTPSEYRKQARVDG